MTTQEIICKVEAIERNRYKVIRRFTLRGSDGKEYAGSLPWGIKCLGRATPYWVFQCHDGTTCGNRYENEAEAIAANQAQAKRHGDEMRKALAEMNFEQLQAQSDYWETQ